MFFGKKAPKLLSTNPGIAVELELQVNDRGKVKSETLSLLNVLAEAMDRANFKVKKQKSWLEHVDSGFLLTPQLVEVRQEEKSIGTTCTIQVNHPRLVPNGVFEYQHSGGTELSAAFLDGFEKWIQTDFETLLDALRPEPQTCTGFKMALPASGNTPERKRRAIFGPVMHFAAKPSPPALSPPAPSLCGDAPSNSETAENGEHQFCPCCLFTKSIDAFDEIVKSNSFCGLRLFASRDHRGIPQSDCRLNGEDFPSGAAALLRYVQTWPGKGVEFRKQYVVVHDL